MSLFSAFPRWLPALLLAAIAAPALAQPADAPSIERLLQATRMQQAYEAAMPTMAQQETQLHELFAEISPTPEQAERIETAQSALRDALSWPNMRLAYARAYQRTLSREEADAIAAYYESEDGQRALGGLPAPSGNPETGDVPTLPVRILDGYYATVGRGRQDKSELLEKNLKDETERRVALLQDQLVAELQKVLETPEH